MATIVSSNGDAFQDRNGESATPFCPPAPSRDFLGWLAMATPPGAPLVKLYCGDAPLIRAPVDGDAAALEAVGERPEFAEALAFLLTRPPVELLPEWLSKHVVRCHVRHRLGIRYWSMEAAYAADLEARASIELANGLGFDDHRDAWLDKKGERHVTMRESSRSVRRYQVTGRRLLHALGAWPWAVVDEGRLPRKWHQAPAFSDAFAAWHRAAWTDTYRRLRSSAAWAGGEWRPWARDHPRAEREAYYAALHRGRR